MEIAKKTIFNILSKIEANEFQIVYDVRNDVIYMEKKPIDESNYPMIGFFKRFLRNYDREAHQVILDINKTDRSIKYYLLQDEKVKNYGQY